MRASRWRGPGWGRPGWWWRARTSRWRRRSGRSCPGTSGFDRARRRSPVATSRDSAHCTTFRSAARRAITGAKRWRCLRRRRARPITSRCTRAIPGRRTGVRDATPGIRLSADRRARGRPCSLGSVWPCSRRPAPLKSSSTKIAASRSWCGHWAARTRHSSTGSRPASIRSPCPIQPCSGSFCGCGYARWSHVRAHPSPSARKRTSSRPCSARWRWSRRHRDGCRG